MPSHRARSETVQGAGGQGGHDVRVADGEGEISGEWKVNSGKLERATQDHVITEILSDMGAEITALEEKLSKARQVKQGMMSMLLTGRVRLV